MRVLLVSTYELGHQPLNLAAPAAGLATAGHEVRTLDTSVEEWNETLVDDNTMACEDLCLADLNGDGKLDIIAAGRATKNVKRPKNSDT